MSRRISGIGLAVATFGAILLVSGTRNVPVADLLRALVKGDGLPSGPSDLAAARNAAEGDLKGATALGAAGSLAGPASAMGQAVADDARKYAGVKYAWAKQDPSTGWDCSGFVTYVLHHDFGIELPSNTHTVALQFLVWSGAATVSRSQCAPGDLVCWPTHVGIATGPNTMMNAPTLGSVTQEQDIWSFPAPVIRRPKVYAAMTPPNTADHGGN